MLFWHIRDVFQKKKWPFLGWHEKLDNPEYDFHLLIQNEKTANGTKNK
jgi:hypothetical protein